MQNRINFYTESSETAESLMMTNFELPLLASHCIDVYGRPME